MSEDDHVDGNSIAAVSVAVPETVAAAPTSLPLPLLFRKAEHSFERLDELSAEKLAQACSVTIQDFETCERFVRTLSLFSKNEEVEDISTSHLKYLLIDYYLHNLHTRVFDIDPTRRRNDIQQSLTYASKFIETCRHLKLLSREQLERWDTEIKNPHKPGTLPVQPSREARIAAFQREKQLKEQLETLRQKQSVHDGEEMDEEDVRSLEQTKLELSINKTFTNIGMMRRELEVRSLLSLSSSSVALTL